MEEWVSLGIDIGGTKIACAAISSDGRILSFARGETVKDDAESLVKAAGELAFEACGSAGVEMSRVRYAGACVPAVVSEDGNNIEYCPNIPALDGFRLAPALAREIGIPVSLSYDGLALTVGEWWAGAAKGYDNVVLICVGTGVGGGLIINGRPYCGASGVAGAVGWFAFDVQQVMARSQNGPQEMGAGELEARAAGPGILRSFNSKSKLKASDTEEVFRLAKDGDALAVEAVQEAGAYLGVAVANIISLLSPQVIVISGGVAGQFDSLKEIMDSAVRYCAQPFSRGRARIVRGKLGDKAGVIGAARISIMKYGGEIDGFN